MNRYEKGVLLGQGTFASVIKATDKKTGKVVAIKTIHAGGAGEGIHVTSLREIKLLREINSPYVVNMLDIFVHKKRLAMVLEFCDSDLEALIKAKGVVLSPGDIKAYMSMLLQALQACHQHWILHRDVKPNNMLISRDGSFKLADFGLARIFGSPDRNLTPRVFATWYRAPELLYGSTAYGPGVDIWAVGCVFAELLLRRPWLPGGTDVDQLGKIFAALGTPNEQNWPGVESLPSYVPFQPVNNPPSLRQQFPGASDDALDLLASMVALDPSKRPSAADALKHPYFSAAPPPTPAHRLPKPPLREDNPLTAPGVAPAAYNKRPPTGGDAPAGKRSKSAAAAAVALSPAAAAAAALHAAGTASPAG